MYPVLIQYIDKYSDIGKTTTNKYHHRRTDNPTYDANMIIDDIARQISDFNFEKKKYDSGGLQDLLLETQMDTGFAVDHLIDDERDNILAEMGKEGPKEIIITDSLFVSTFMQDKETIENEGNKIIAYLTKFFLDNDKNEEESKIYKNLKFVYHNGYVYVYRTDIPLKDIVTDELLSEEIFFNESTKQPLKYLRDVVIGNSVPYDLLRPIMLMPYTNFFITEEKERFEEASKVLSIEYVIAMSPQPRYQIWTLIQLIKLWYCDIGMQNNVKKMKILINQAEANSDLPFNMERGTKPSIAIYPRYGKNAATIVIKRIADYFLPYMRAVTWTTAKPDYFIEYFPLLWYTNTTNIMKSLYDKIIKIKTTHDRIELKMPNTNLMFPPVRLQTIN